MADEIRTTRLQRIVGKSIAYAVIVPWRTLLLPMILLGALSDWYTFTADRWLQRKVGPVDSSIERFAWNLGRRAVGVKTQ